MLADRNSNGRAVRRGAKVSRLLVSVGFALATGVVTALAAGVAPQSAELDRLRQRRADLGLPADDSAPLLIDPETGAPVALAAIPLHLRRARVTQAGIDANASMCSGMLRYRYTPG